MFDIDSDPKVRTALQVAAPALGIILIAGGIYLGSFALEKFLHPGRRAPLDNAWGGLILTICAIAIVVVGTRLVTGLHRKDGGVLPPIVILIGSCLLAITAPIAMFFISGNPHAAVAGGLIFAYVAAKGIQLYRQRKDTQKNHSAH